MQEEQDYNEWCDEMIQEYERELEANRETELDRFIKRLNYNDFAIGDSFWIEGFEFEVVNTKTDSERF